jgi:hypothetical protein
MYRAELQLGFGKEAKASVKGTSCVLHIIKNLSWVAGRLQHGGK